MDQITRDKGQIQGAANKCSKLVKVSHLDRDQQLIMKNEKENNNGSKRRRVEGRRDDDVADAALTTTKLNGDDGQTSITAHYDKTTDDTTTLVVGIPTLRRDSRTGLISFADFFHAFGRYRAVYIPRTESSDTTATEELASSRDNNTNNKSHVEEKVQEEQKKETQKRLTANDIHDVFLSLNDKNDIESWCIENDGEPNNNTMKIKSSNNNGSISGKGTIGGDDNLHSYDFLRLNNDPKEKSKRGYCSFIIQNDKAVMNSTLERLPIKDLPIDDDDGSTNDKHIASTDMLYGPCLWFFFGRNSSNEQLPLQGRPEHTDSITHDATWHYQLSGTKRWVIRPTLELLKRINNSSCEEVRGNEHKWPLQTTSNEKHSNNEDLNDRKGGSDTTATEKDYDSNGGIPATVECQEGDILVINTHLWWHQTFLPYHPTTPSVSYARDVYFQNKKVEASLNKDEATSTKTTKPSSEIPVAASSMTNVDGLYAANDIEASTIIFREDTMPDCELHRSSQPNCEVVQLDDGTGAVVSLRPISAGEFFSVAESDESEEDGEEEYDDDEEE